MVGSFLKTNMTIFGGKLADAESTIMPEVRQWAKATASDVGNGPEDHMVCMMVNCPGLGIFGASAKAFLLSFITNVLADFPENGIALLVFPNRASQHEGRRDHIMLHIKSLIGSIKVLQSNFKLKCDQFKISAYHPDRKPGVTKDEDDDMDQDAKQEIKEQDEDDDDDDEDKTKAKEGEELQIRDVQYKLENLVSKSALTSVTPER